LGLLFAVKVPSMMESATHFKSLNHFSLLVLENTAQ